MGKDMMSRESSGLFSIGSIRRAVRSEKSSAQSITVVIDSISAAV